MNRAEIRVLEDSELDPVNGGLIKELSSLIAKGIDVICEELAIAAEINAVGGGKIDFWP